MRCKCRICKKNLDTKDAYLVVDEKDKKAYYCSQEEYETDKINREKAEYDKDKVYRLICEIIGRKEITNTVLWKEKTIWNKVAADEVIWKYLQENIDYLSSTISKLENKEFNRIRYLSAIIKNSIGDFKEQIKTQKQAVIRTENNFEFYETVSRPKSKRKGLSTLEDEL